MTKRENRGERALHFFLDRPGVEVNTFVLERRFGRRSWRTAVSDGRKLARMLRRDIKWKPYWRGRKGHKVCDSRYVLVKIGKAA